MQSLCTPCNITWCVCDELETKRQWMLHLVVVCMVNVHCIIASNHPLSLNCVCVAMSMRVVVVHAHKQSCTVVVAVVVVRALWQHEDRQRVLCVMDGCKHTCCSVVALPPKQALLNVIGGTASNRMPLLCCICLCCAVLQSVVGNKTMCAQNNTHKSRACVCVHAVLFACHVSTTTTTQQRW